MVYKTPPEKMLKEMSHEWYLKIIDYFADDDALTDDEILEGFQAMRNG